MQNYFVFILFLLVFKTSAQNDSKAKFQKNRYELAISHYKNSDYIKAVDLFFLSSKIDPESPIGQESIQIADTLKTLLRKDLTDKLVGTWRKTGNQPEWVYIEKNEIIKKEYDEIMVITPNNILFYERNISTNETKLIKSEELIFYSKENLYNLHSQVIFSDNKIWTYLLDKDAKTLRTVNTGIDKKEGSERIVKDQQEVYYEKIK